LQTKKKGEPTLEELTGVPVPVPVVLDPGE